ncbi:hypothetical protein COU60_05410 [Candidatus Pacearchaeota archaeon CG10_big_fil_rev_8_21_14_0_10_34_76]|nr:MAG: hypothetical protein COU60_05410 [Candidatus Pacearchaeota archaeon CG10_big_fil_rev_8_21_14_0_10_34_76]
MKRIIVVHQWGSSPEGDWYPWIKNELESNGFEVHVLEMPESDEPKIESWVGALKEVVGDLNRETYFIGHSVGCQTILRYLEKSEFMKKAGGCVFVAPWMHLQGLEEEEGAEEIAREWLETPVDFKEVRKHCEKFVCVFSDNDPFVPLSDRDIFREILGAKIITEHEKGHFTKDDGVEELPVVLEEFLKFLE